MSVVVFLQNAWSPVYAGGEWPRESWLRALARSRSGKRIELLGAGLECCWNLTPIVGAEPSSFVEPDAAYIVSILRDIRPRIVVACGKHAEEYLRLLWVGPLICIPHPASRLVTLKLFLRAREILAEKFRFRIALRQRRGAVEEEMLAGRNRRRLIRPVAVTDL